MIDPKPDTSQAVDFVMRLMENAYTTELNNLRRKVAGNYKVLLANKNGVIPQTTTIEEIDHVIRSAASKLAEEGTDFRQFTENSPDTILEIILSHLAQATSISTRDFHPVTIVPSKAEIQAKMAEVQSKTEYILDLLTVVEEAEPVRNDLAQHIINAPALRKALNGPEKDRNHQINDMLQIAAARVIVKNPNNNLATEHLPDIGRWLKTELTHMNQEIKTKHPDLQKIAERNIHEAMALVTRELLEMKAAVLPTISGNIKERQSRDNGESRNIPNF